MNLRNEFNRVGHIFHNGKGKTQQVTEDWAEKQSRQATATARRVREQIDTGTRSLVTAEEAIVHHVRENPALYLIGTALVIGVLIAKLIIESRQTRTAPLL
jgi:sensor c-di-GMP phosphodiesterase-like protein